MKALFLTFMSSEVLVRLLDWVMRNFAAIRMSDWTLGGLMLTTGFGLYARRVKGEDGSWSRRDSSCEDAGSTAGFLDMRGVLPVSPSPAAGVIPAEERRLPGAAPATSPVSKLTQSRHRSSPTPLMLPSAITMDPTSL